IEQILIDGAKKALKKHYDVSVDAIELQATRKDFQGDITLVVFPLLRHIKGNPVTIGETLGQYLQDELDEVKSFNVVKGFLNLVYTDAYFFKAFNSIRDEDNYGLTPVSDDAETVMVEYSSPNKNNPLRHDNVRNNLLGYAVAEIIGATGKKVYKTQIINDRGIHICKSMLAWQKFAEKDAQGNRLTPESTGVKGDKFVGDFYVKFDKAYKAEIANLVADGMPEEEAKKKAPLLQEAKAMLKKWEEGDVEVVALWKTMNSWVYKGFEETYTNLGVDFDKNYYESNTYLLGKETIEDGLERGVFFKKDDGSVWIDLTADGLDEKLVLRADGTAVYMTQDIGTAI